MLGIWHSKCLRKMWISVLLCCTAGWSSPAVMISHVPELCTLCCCTQSANVLAGTHSVVLDAKTLQPLPSPVNGVPLPCCAMVSTSSWHLGHSQPSAPLNPLLLSFAFGKQVLSFILSPLETQGDDTVVWLQRCQEMSSEAGRGHVKIRGMGTSCIPAARGGVELPMRGLPLSGFFISAPFSLDISRKCLVPCWNTFLMSVRQFPSEDGLLLPLQAQRSAGTKPPAHWIKIRGGGVPVAETSSEPQAGQCAQVQRYLCT